MKRMSTVYLREILKVSSTPLAVYSLSAYSPEGALLKSSVPPDVGNIPLAVACPLIRSANTYRKVSLDLLEETVAVAISSFSCGMGATVTSLEPEVTEIE